MREKERKREKPKEKRKEDRNTFRCFTASTRSRVTVKLYLERPAPVLLTKERTERFDCSDLSVFFFFFFLSSCLLVVLLVVVLLLVLAAQFRPGAAAVMHPRAGRVPRPA